MMWLKWSWMREYLEEEEKQGRSIWYRSPFYYKNIASRAIF